jgi:hypothetical protein
MVDALINAIQKDERNNFLSGNIHSISSWNMDLVEFKLCGQSTGNIWHANQNCRYHIQKKDI